MWSGFHWNSVPAVSVGTRAWGRAGTEKRAAVCSSARAGDGAAKGGASEETHGRHGPQPFTDPTPAGCSAASESSTRVGDAAALRGIPNPGEGSGAPETDRLCRALGRTPREAPDLVNGPTRSLRAGYSSGCHPCKAAVLGAEGNGGQALAAVESVQRTGIQFYQPSHSPKNPSAGSPGTRAGRVLAPVRLSRKTPHNQSGRKRIRPHALGCRPPPVHSADLRDCGPQPSSALHPL